MFYAFNDKYFMKGPARFTPPKGVVFGKVKQLRQAHVEDLTGTPDAHLIPQWYSEFRVTFDVDPANRDTFIKKIPIRFFVHSNRDVKDSKQAKENAVVRSMTMQDLNPPSSPQKVTSEALGPEGKRMYSRYRGYAHGVVALATFLRNRGVKTLWIPDAASTEPGLKPHVAERIYDGTSRSLGLGAPQKLPPGIHESSGTKRYYRLDTDDVAHLEPYLKSD